MAIMLLRLMYSGSLCNDGNGIRQDGVSVDDSGIPLKIEVNGKICFNCDKSSAYLYADDSTEAVVTQDGKDWLAGHSRNATAVKDGLEMQKRSIGYEAITMGDPINGSMLAGFVTYCKDRNFRELENGMQCVRLNRKQFVIFLSDQKSI